MRLNIIKNHLLLAILSFSLSCILTGCTDEQLRAYVERFDKSVQSAAGAVRQKYLGVNDLKRTAYLTMVRLKPGTRIETKSNINGIQEPTGLVQYYSDEYIEARLVALQALTSYTEGLALMAASDSPTKSEQAMKVTGERLTQLSGRLQALNTTTSPVDVTRFATPISRLAGIASRNILEYIKDRNLKQSLLDSQETVRQLSGLLIDDLDEINSSVEGADWASLLARYQALYNDDPKLLDGSYTDPSRTTVIKDIEQVAKRYADLKSTNPSKLVRNIQLSHDQIVDYLNTNQKNRSKEEFSLQIEADLKQFENDAKLVSQSADRIEAAIRASAHDR